jgi:hypothetical protein
VLFRFYCDESHDSTNQRRKAGEPPFEPRSYVVGGVFGDELSWAVVEKGWARKNKLEGVARFHAAHLNAGTWEYDGWPHRRRVAYSKQMLKILKKPGRRMHGVSIGLFADEYRRIISQEGRLKLGHPYFVCFKTAMTTIASQMDHGRFPPEDQVAVVIDRNEFAAEAVGLFGAMKNDPSFQYRHRLATCTQASSDEVVGLQVADFVAYEAFRLMHGKRTQADFDMRAPMRNVLGRIGFLGFAFGVETLEQIKDDVDRMPSNPNGFFIVPPWFAEEDAEEHAKVI